MKHFKESAVEVTKKTGENLKIFGQNVSVKSKVAGSAISEKTTEIKAKLIEKQIGSKLKSFFKKKPSDKKEEKE